VWTAGSEVQGQLFSIADVQACNRRGSAFTSMRTLTLTAGAAVRLSLLPRLVRRNANCMRFHGGEPSYTEDSI
jgi:hypothetical protein